MDTAASAGFSFGQGSASTQGFSIPIKAALKIAAAITGGHASSTVHIGPTAFLGVGVASSSLGGPTGAVIESVASGSPAAKAGLVEGDTITTCAGHSVSLAERLGHDPAEREAGRLCLARLSLDFGRAAYRHGSFDGRASPVEALRRTKGTSRHRKWWHRHDSRGQ